MGEAVEQGQVQLAASRQQAAGGGSPADSFGKQSTRRLKGNKPSSFPFVTNLASPGRPSDWCPWPIGALGRLVPLAGSDMLRAQGPKKPIDAKEIQG